MTGGWNFQLAWLRLRGMVWNVGIMENGKTAFSNSEGRHPCRRDVRPKLVML
jgi:hypothetical protein